MKFSKLLPPETPSQGVEVPNFFEKNGDFYSMVGNVRLLSKYTFSDCMLMLNSIYFYAMWNENGQMIELLVLYLFRDLVA